MNLLRTEWLKMRKYNAFWWIMGLTILSYPGVNYIIYNLYLEIMREESQTAQVAKMAIGNPFAFPDVWRTVGFASSILTFIPAVVVIMFITNEYSFRTHRQNIIDGWNRRQFITAKMIDVLIVSLMITTLYFIIALVAGFTNHTRLIRDVWGESYFVGLFFLQTFSQLSLAFLVGFLVRRAFMALGIFLFYYFILDNLIYGLLTYYKKTNFGKFLPLEISDRLMPVPPFIGKFDPAKYQRALDEIPLFTILTVLLTILIWMICYRINSRKDLK